MNQSAVCVNQYRCQLCGDPLHFINFLNYLKQSSFNFETSAVLLHCEQRIARALLIRVKYVHKIIEGVRLGETLTPNFAHSELLVEITK